LELQEYFENKHRPHICINNSTMIGWYSMGGNNRVKHYYIRDPKLSNYPRALCNDGYIFKVEFLKEHATKNPLARITKKCLVCKRIINAKRSQGCQATHKGSMKGA